MRTGDTSRPVKFDPGTLVKWTRGNVDRVYVVDHNSKSNLCWIMRYSMAEPLPIIEEEVRALTFREFLLYKDPVTGGLKIGKNRAWPLLIANLLGLVFIGCTFTVEWPWWPGPLIVGLGIIGITIYGTWRNYKGKQA